MSKKTTQLEVEITALIRKFNKLQNEIDRIQQQLGYKKLFSSAHNVEYDYFDPKLSVSEKIEAMINYLNIDIRKIKLEEHIMVLKKRSARRKITSKGGKDATKKQKE